MQVDLAGLSHQGLVRSRNEDCFLIVRADRTLRTIATNLVDAAVPATFNELGFGMLVADGMGGMAGGDVASRMAVQTLMTLVLNTPDWIMRTGERENERILERIAERYKTVDSVIREEAAVDPRGIRSLRRGRPAVPARSGDRRLSFDRPRRLRARRGGRNQALGSARKAAHLKR